MARALRIVSVANRGGTGAGEPPLNEGRFLEGGGNVGREIPEDAGGRGGNESGAPSGTQWSQGRGAGVAGAQRTRPRTPAAQDHDRPKRATTDQPPRVRI